MKSAVLQNHVAWAMCNWQTWIEVNDTASIETGIGVLTKLYQTEGLSTNQAHVLDRLKMATGDNSLPPYSELTIQKIRADAETVLTHYQRWIAERQIKAISRAVECLKELRPRYGLTKEQEFALHTLQSAAQQQEPAQMNNTERFNTLINGIKNTGFEALKARTSTLVAERENARTRVILSWLRNPEPKLEFVTLAGLEVVPTEAGKDHLDAFFPKITCEYIGIATVFTPLRTALEQEFFTIQACCELDGYGTDKGASDIRNLREIARRCAVGPCDAETELLAKYAAV